MTSTSLVEKTSNLPGDGSNFTFSFSPLIIYENTDIEVFHIVTATGVETQVTEGTGATNYVFNGPTTFPGTGTITYPGDSGTAIPSTEAMVIKKVLPLTQDTDLQNQGGYFPEVLERRLDKIVGMIIQHQETLDRCLKIPITDALITDTEINPGNTRDASEFVRVNSAATGFITSVGAASTSGSASDATPADVNLSAGASGSNAAYSRDDHAHLLPTTVPRLATETIWTESQVWKKGSDVASANAMTLGAGNLFDITGTTQINTITTIGVGTIIILQFDGALTLNHNTNDLILPGAVDIVTQAGDIAMFYEYNAGDWRLISYIHGTATNGRMPGPDFESAETALNNDSTILFAHGLGAVPSKVEVILRSNTATAQGYADNVDLPFSMPWSGAVADDFVQVASDATNIAIAAGANIQLLDIASFNEESITQSQYDWVVRGWV